MITWWWESVPRRDQVLSREYRKGTAMYIRRSGFSQNRGLQVTLFMPFGLMGKKCMTVFGKSQNFAYYTPNNVYNVCMLLKISHSYAVNLMKYDINQILYTHTHTWGTRVHCKSIWRHVRLLDDNVCHLPIATLFIFFLHASRIARCSPLSLDSNLKAQWNLPFDMTYPTECTPYATIRRLPFVSRLYRHRT